MELHLLGLNHKTAPVEVREKVAITNYHLREALLFFLAEERAREAVIVSTCNRTEIYTAADDFSGSLSFFENYFHIWASDYEKYLYHHTGTSVVEHLFRVSSGLDSMIVGEGQVLGQIKTALAAAQEVKSTKALLNTVFNRAVSCGKRSRTETKISQGAVSVGAAAVELAKKIFGSLKPKQVLMIGAGKMSEAAAKLLQSKVVFVANRTYARAEELAGKIGGKAVKFDELDDYLASCDIVISSTDATHYLISKPRVQNVMKERGGNPLFMIDIAVPRDIDPRVGELPQVYLYDIDDLNAIAAENLKERQAEIPKVEKVITEEKEKYLTWRAQAAHRKQSLSAPAAAGWH